MTSNQVIELAKQVYGTDKWTDAQLERLQRFAEMVRNEAIEETIKTLEFHGFDDAIPYIKWAAVNRRSKK